MEPESNKTAIPLPLKKSPYLSQINSNGKYYTPIIEKIIYDNTIVPTTRAIQLLNCIYEPTYYEPHCRLAQAMLERNVGTNGCVNTLSEVIPIPQL